MSMNPDDRQRGEDHARWLEAVGRLVDWIDAQLRRPGPALLRLADRIHPPDPERCTCPPWTAMTVDGCPVHDRTP